MLTFKIKKMKRICLFAIIAGFIGNILAIMAGFNIHDLTYWVISLAISIIAAIAYHFLKPNKINKTK